MRKKTRSITMFVDPKYEHRLRLIKATTGITAFVENALDKVDEQLLTEQILTKFNFSKGNADEQA